MYSVGPNNELTALVETKYERELDLQELVASHPALLAGSQMTPPRSFMLLTKEAGIAIAAEASSYFSLDLLFVDQDAVLTFVEIKRSSDTRARREVVGQLIEYAANACAFWNVDRLRAEFEKRFTDPDLELSTTLAVSVDQREMFWQRIYENLKQETIRLIFVADSWSLETQRMVTFLNRHMDCDVYAVEIRQFTGTNTKTLVARLLNPSVAETDRKLSNAHQPGEQWTNERFYEALGNKLGQETVAAVRSIQDGLLEIARTHVFFGRGRILGSLQFAYMGAAGAITYRSGRDVVFCTIWSDGTVEIDMEYLVTHPPFDDVAVRDRYLEQLASLPSVVIDPRRREKRPTFPATALLSAEAREQFLTAQRNLVNLLISREASGG